MTVLPGFLRGRSAVLLATAVACVLETLPGMPGLPLTLAGLWLLLGAPVAVWRGTAARVVSGRDSSLLLAVGFAIITDLLVALGVDLLLPLFGDAHPLTRVPLAGASAMVLTALGAFLPEEAREEAAPRARPPGLLPVALLGTLAVVLCVAGAIRLNNGYSGAVSTVALVAVAALLVLLLARRRRYPVPVLELGLFLAAAGMLLLNALRGWFITGHDIQSEYEYFRLAFGGSVWTPDAYPNAYNACLSITLLPVSFVRLTAVQDVYVFKLVLPLLFALTPVLLYRSVRNVAPQLVALLSAVYFVAFPTFFNDMTFLGRQEVAFLLLGCAMMVLTDQGRPLRARRAAFAVLSVGLVLSHYSTTYVVVAVLGAAWAADVLWRAADWRKKRPRRRKDFRAPSFVSWWLVLLPAALALVWAGPVTHTDGQLRVAVAAVYQDVRHGFHGTSGSSDTAYSIFGGTKVSAAQRLSQYRQDTLDQRQANLQQAAAAKRRAADYIPLTAADAYPVTLAAQQNMPLTMVGQALQSAGLPVAGTNTLLRQAASLLLQLLVAIGYLVTVRARRHRGFRPLRDQLTLTIGALVLLALLTFFPQLSVDYGVLRAFQQGLFFFAPFIAAGTLWLLHWAGRRSVPLVCVLVTGLFLDLTGVVPKLLGGYPAQLQLSNAGQYYDIYYPHLTEREAAYWLEQKIATDSSQFVQTDHFTFGRLQTLITGPAQGDLYPTLLNMDSYVLLGTTTVQTGRMTVSYQGDLVTFQFPEGFLDATKNEIYSSEGAEIYR